MKLELSKLFKPPSFILDVKRNCYRPDKMNASLKFEFQVAKEEKTLYMIAFTYNSMRKPHLILKINNNIISNNLLKKATLSYDKLMALREEDGPFYLEKGINTIEIISERIFPDTYELELYPYSENINKAINPYSYKMSDFVYLDCYNIYGGFYWHINNFLICSYFCEKFGKIPIVNFNSGLFVNNTSIENNMIRHNQNWFYNYFQSYVSLPPSIYQAVLENPHKVRIDNKSMVNFKKYHKFCNDNQVLQFKREAFLYFRDYFYQDKKYKELINKYLQPLPHIRDLVEEIKKKHFPLPKDNLKLIGIHYRGTDKIEEELCPEQKPKHYSYEAIYEMIVDKARTLIQERGDYDIYIVGCSDEKPFLDFLKHRLKNKFICYEDAVRSFLNTSELDTDFKKIPNRNKNIDVSNLNDSQTKIYNQRKELLDNSVHLGNKNISNYKKGMDCLIDCLLLEDVDILYKSKGNFSLYCEFFNRNENAEIINIHDILKS